jgi:hypothetical protein
MTAGIWADAVIEQINVFCLVYSTVLAVLPINGLLWTLNICGIECLMLGTKCGLRCYISSLYYISPWQAHEKFQMFCHLCWPMHL